MHRRTLAPVAAALLAARPLAAQEARFPSRPVRVVSGNAPGGISDIICRLVAPQLGRIWDRPVMVENRPGASGHAAGAEVARSPADGHAILLTTMAHNAVTAIYQNLGYDPLADLRPAILVGESMGVLAVPPAFPARDVAQFIAMARERPGGVTYGSAGAGSAIHLGAALFEHMAQVRMTHVPYRGSAPALNDLLAGQINAVFDNLTSALPFIQAGRLRALAVTGHARSPALPGIPTIAEAGVPGYAFEAWYGFSVASATPPDILQRLNTDLNAAIMAPELRPRWAALGITPLGGSLADAERKRREDTALWNGVVRAANITAE
ncbi:tripartite tricarboxylate transporter substrate binding protein [Roseococcus sp. DSY-14]|uniref:tripartite tricarboxylate transporter substrate binding protein n=1 Tax=Roseococcus sp. DSY-14 TaxID=3369650 RepID=UPI00387B7DD5